METVLIYLHKRDVISLWYIYQRAQKDVEDKKYLSDTTLPSTNILCRPTYIYVRVTISTSAKILGRCASFLCIFFQRLHIFYTELHLHIYIDHIYIIQYSNLDTWYASCDMIVPLHIYIYIIILICII